MSRPRIVPKDVEFEAPPNALYYVYRGTQEALIEAGLATPGMFPKPPKRVARGWIDGKQHWTVRRAKGGRFILELGKTDEQMRRDHYAAMTKDEFADALCSLIAAMLMLRQMAAGEDAPWRLEPNRELLSQIDGVIKTAKAGQIVPARTATTFTVVQGGKH